MKKYEKIYVLDTNILLQDATSIIKLSDKGKNLIIFPETVLDEIDNKKSGFEEINFQAREFGRLLSETNIKKIEKEIFESTYTIIHSNLKRKGKEEIDFQIISKDEYIVEKKNISTNILNDRKILEIANYVNNKYKNVVFISLDIMARVRSISFGIKTETLIGEKKEEINFIKTINLKDEVSKDFLHNKDIIDFDEKYKNNVYSYIFELPSKNKYFATIINKKISIIDMEILNKQDVTPLNLHQKFLSSAILSKKYKILICEGLAGSGKTLISLSSAIQLLKKKEFDGITYVRNSIESLDKGEEIGFLPGYEEKFAIYNHPLMDSLKYIVKNNIKKSNNGKNKEIEINELNEKTKEYMNKYNIETKWVGEMRGSTIFNKIVIIDEAQNMSNKTLQMILSRIDKNSIVLVLGSNKQIDNHYINKYTNGLTTLLYSTLKEEENVNIFAINLEKVLRGPITEWAEKVFS